MNNCFDIFGFKYFLLLSWLWYTSIETYSQVLSTSLWRSLQQDSFHYQYLHDFITLINIFRETQELKSDQVEWVKDTTSLVYRLLSETPPNGKRFAECVKHILKREEHWNSWKNDGCPGKIETVSLFCQLFNYNLSRYTYENINKQKLFIYHAKLFFVVITTKKVK